MSRRTRIILNEILLLVLSSLFFTYVGLYPSALLAFRNAERTLHYGPSEIAHIENYPDGKLIVGKYDKWISCTVIRRVLLVFWTFDGAALGLENDTSEAAVCSWDYSKQRYRLYGIVNAPSAGKVEVMLVDGTVLTQTELHDDVFLFTWKDEQYRGRGGAQVVRVYDTAGALLFEHEYYRPGELGNGETKSS